MPALPRPRSTSSTGRLWSGFGVAEQSDGCPKSVLSLSQTCLKPASRRQGQAPVSQAKHEPTPLATVSGTMPGGVRPPGCFAPAQPRRGCPSGLHVLEDLSHAVRGAFHAYCHPRRRAPDGLRSTHAPAPCRGRDRAGRQTAFQGRALGSHPEPHDPNPKNPTVVCNGLSVNKFRNNSNSARPLKFAKTPPSAPLLRDRQ